VLRLESMQKVIKVLGVKVRGVGRGDNSDRRVKVDLGGCGTAYCHRTAATRSSAIPGLMRKYRTLNIFKLT
jgi:hypothetical protein